MPTKENISIFVVGVSGSGKSSLIRRITENAFSPEYKSSFRGMSQPTTTVFTDAGDEVCVSFRDEGDDKYAPSSLNLFKAFNTFIVVYDVSDQYSLELARVYCKTIQETRNDTDGIILVGNKCDMESAINPEDVQRFVENENILHIETSAKENINIQEMLMLLLSRRLGNPCSGIWLTSSTSAPESKNSSSQIQNETTERGTELSQSLSTSNSHKIQPQSVTTTRSESEQVKSFSISNSEKNNASQQNVTTPERSSCCVIS